MTGKRAIGRPRKAPAELRTERFSGIRLTMAERVRIEELAARAGLDVAEFCRRAILGQRIEAQTDRAAHARLIAEINRIGVNLNQLTHAAHIGRILPASLEVAAQEIRDLVQGMTEAAE